MEEARRVLRSGVVQARVVRLGWFERDEEVMLPIALTIGVALTIGGCAGWGQRETPRSKQPNYTGGVAVLRSRRMLLRLYVSAENGIHACQVALAVGLEPFGNVRIEAQMH